MEEIDGNRAQRRAAKQQTLAREQMENDARAVLKHAPSVRFICRILDECRYYEDPFAGNSNTTFKNVGEQEAGRKIVRALQSVEPDALIILLEAVREQRAKLMRKRYEDTSDEH